MSVCGVNRQERIERLLSGIPNPTFVLLCSALLWFCSALPYVWILLRIFVGGISLYIFSETLLWPLRAARRVGRQTYKGISVRPAIAHVCYILICAHVMADG